MGVHGTFAQVSTTSFQKQSSPGWNSEFLYLYRSPVGLAIGSVHSRSAARDRSATQHLRWRFNVLLFRGRISMKRNCELWRHRAASLAVCLCLSLLTCCSLVRAQSNSSERFELNDSHFHLTNSMHPGRHKHTRLSEDHGHQGRPRGHIRHPLATAVRGRIRIPAILPRPTTCRRDAPLYYITPSPTPTLRWRTGRYRRKSGRASTR